MSRHNKGFTLLEMLLVLAILSALVYMTIGYIQQRTLRLRVSTTVQQMQQVLSAGLSYHVMNGHWPIHTGMLNCLRGVDPNCPSKLLPANFTHSPWIGAGGAPAPYKTFSNRSSFYVYTTIDTNTAAQSNAYAKLVVGQLPLGYIATSAASLTTAIPNCTNKLCIIVASVTLPRDSLSNDSALNFAGIYHHGGCIPVPECPVDGNGNTTTPEVFVVPVQVSGVFDKNNSTNVYPISSFTAYATGGDPSQNAHPPLCRNMQGKTTGHGCRENESGETSSAYWRACLDITTEKGNVNINRTLGDNWGDKASLAAYTRCAPQNEASGSTFNMYGD